SSVWTPTLTRGPVKLDEVNSHSACRRVGRVGDVILKGKKSSNGQIWQNLEKSEYHRVIGVVGLNLRSWVESRHVGLFGELGRARQTTRRFTKVPHLAYNFMLYLKFDSVTFGEKLEVAEGTRRFAESLFDRPLFAPLNPFTHCTLNAVGDSLKGLPIANMLIFLRMLSQSFW
ncbi:hypothetical protein H5410_061149, partial [Solanum commersonii]